MKNILKVGGEKWNSRDISFNDIVFLMGNQGGGQEGVYFCLSGYGREFLNQSGLFRNIIRQE